MVSDGGGANQYHHHSAAEMSFRIAQDGRFFSRLMSKESSTANSSSRVFYYGEKSVAAVPFMWEAQPGTPKHPLSETSLPPLTPPPSYYSTNKSNAKRRNYSKFSSILPRLSGSRKSHVSPTSSSSSSWSPSSSSSSSIAFSSSSFLVRDKDVQGQCGSLSFSSIPGSPLNIHKCSNGFRGCYPFANMKNATM